MQAHIYTSVVGYRYASLYGIFPQTAVTTPYIRRQGIGQKIDYFLTVPTVSGRKACDASKVRELCLEKVRNDYDLGCFAISWAKERAGGL